MTVLSLSPGVVLCFENDGHIEVEFGLNGECCLPFNEALQKPFTFISSEQDCNSFCEICVDVPLYITAERKHNDESIVLDLLVSLLQTASYSTAVTTLFFDQPTLRNPFHTVSITAFHVSTIQTVILLV
ncbi:MAG: hypothetical protein ACUZ8E_04490 [Candidatus Anammoxibacter sp.]